MMRFRNRTTYTTSPDAIPVLGYEQFGQHASKSPELLALQLADTRTEALAIDPVQDAMLAEISKWEETVRQRALGGLSLR